MRILVVMIEKLITCLLVEPQLVPGGVPIHSIHMQSPNNAEADESRGGLSQQIWTPRPLYSEMYGPYQLSIAEIQKGQWLGSGQGWSGYM